MTTEERIVKLERELGETRDGLRAAQRLSRWVFCLGMVAIVTSIIAACTPGNDKAIRVKHLVLIGPNGETRAEMGVTNDGPYFGMYDEDGVVRAIMLVTASGPEVSIGNESGDARITMAVTEDEPMLGMSDVSGRARLRMMVADSGPELLMADGNGTNRSIFTAGEAGPLMGMFDNNGVCRVGLMAVDGEAALVMADQSGGVRALLVVTEDGLGFELYDEEQKAIW